MASGNHVNSVSAKKETPEIEPAACTLDPLVRSTMKSLLSPNTCSCSVLPSPRPCGAPLLLSRSRPMRPGPDPDPDLRLRSLSSPFAPRIVGTVPALGLTVCTNSLTKTPPRWRKVSHDPSLSPWPSLAQLEEGGLRGREKGGGRQGIPEPGCGSRI